ncbi:MAG: hypothetical protein GC191_17055 [Azospirillum sp.]|nr:hypothetical protein [Azospirillum sp.]
MNSNPIVQYLHHLAVQIVEMVHAGGVVAYFLLFMLAWCLIVVAIKAAGLRRKRIIRPAIIQDIERLLIDGKLAEATAYCKKSAYPMARIILAGILHYDRSEPEIKERLEEAGRQELPAIRKHLTTLRSLASAAPLVGLFGTVIGMINVFATLSKGTTIEASALAGGISQALITTAIGLLVAVPAIVSYNDFSNRVNNFVVEMEKISLNMVAILKRGG